MIVVTTFDVPGKRTVKALGLVRGNTIRSSNLGRDFLALCRNVAGGELYEYTKLMAESREQALDRMVEEAKSLGANAIVGVRFASSEITTNAAEILAYGTAVQIEDAS